MGAEKGFGAQGEGRVDPHCFRVVGGSFMNNAGRVEEQNSTPLTATSLQPLSALPRAFSKCSAISGMTSDGDDMGDELLTPFFSGDGKAPWEKSHPPFEPARSARDNSKGLALLSGLR